MYGGELTETLEMLAAIVNRAGKAKQTTAEAVKVAEVPVILLTKARDLLEQYRDTEYGTPALLHATNRVFG